MKEKEKEKENKIENEDKNDDGEVSRVIVPVVIFGAYDLVRYNSVHFKVFKKNNLYYLQI